MGLILRSLLRGRLFHYRQKRRWHNRKSDSAFNMDAYRPAREGFSRDGIPVTVNSSNSPSQTPRITLPRFFDYYGSVGFRLHKRINKRLQDGLFLFR